MPPGNLGSTRDASWLNALGAHGDTMDICAPKDGFVTDVLFTAADRKVKTGSPLLQMDTDYEDRMASRLATREAVREISSAQYTGPQLQLLTDLAQVAVDLASTKADKAKRKYLSLTTGVQQGITPTPDMVMAQNDSTIADLELDRAKKQQEQLKYVIERHTEIDAKAKEFFEEEEAFISKRRMRLTIVAPVDGEAKFLVAKGSFAKRGTVLVRIE
jgi:multidrug resistance efflux pump